ncbi:MAG: DUF1329 domain-containing protein, partial [Halioglobus sp.]|nr:DUF1329 domain-containing protein [Halioglobus sp.]
MTHIRCTLIALTLALLPGFAQAKLPAEELAKLGTQYTPMGALRAGNEDGQIPEWTGEIMGLPEGLQWAGPGEPYPDPWPEEKPLFSITRDNLDDYRDRLSPGQIAMFETYGDTFRMPVYKSHRSFRFYEQYYDKVRHNAANAQLYNNDEGIRGYIGGPAFPRPATGAEVVWLTRTTVAHA